MYSRLKDKLCEYLNWKNISFFGKSKFVGSFSYWFLIVPFLAKGTNYIEYYLPFNLKVFFACSLCFGVSNILYKVYCPDVIKLYKDPQDFLSKGGNSYQLQKIIEEYSDKHPENLMNQIEAEIEKDQLKVEFSKLVDHFNIEKCFVRYIISFFYLIALLLLSIVVYMNIATVFGFTNNFCCITRE